MILPVQITFRNMKPSEAVDTRVREEGYGFLTTSDGSEVYFHQNSVLNDAFNRLTIGARVTFDEELGEKGVQASTVRAVG